MKKNIININIERLVDKIEVNGEVSEEQIQNIRKNVLEALEQAVKEVTLKV